MSAAAATANDPLNLVGQMFDDRYRVVGLLGRGGMGVVYQAVHTSSDQTVALKVLFRQFSEREHQLNRFSLELKASSKLNHPNTVRVLDYGRSTSGYLFIAMEYLKGETLAALLRRNKTISARRLCNIAIQICAALTEAHDKGVVHRDLKPDNVFLCKVSGDQDSVRLLDFGVAKITDGDPDKESYTQTGFICGTPRYISPEQALGKSLDGRADLYSLGVMLFEMVTGESVFRADTPIALVMKHVHDAPPIMEDVNPNVQIIPALRDLIYSLLEKSSSKRPSTAQEVADALNELRNSRTSMPAAAVPIVREGKGLKRSVSSHTMVRAISTTTGEHTAPRLPAVSGGASMDTDEDGIEPPLFDATQMLSISAIAEQLAAHNASVPAEEAVDLAGSGLIELRAGVGTGRNWSGLFMAAVILLALGTMVVFLSTNRESGESTSLDPALSEDAMANHAIESVDDAAGDGSRAFEAVSRQPTRPVETGAVKSTSAAAPKPAESPIPSFVLLESQPTEAMVIIRGRLVGQTPYRFQPTKDTAATTVIVSKDGHLPESWHYEPSAQLPTGQRTVKIVLPPMPSIKKSIGTPAVAPKKKRKRRWRKPSVIWED